MKRIAEVVGQPLAWSQPSAVKQEYELRTGDALVATVSFRNSFGSFATARSGDGCWTFKRVGFWTTRATIRECDGDAEVGSYKNNTWKGGGTLELPGARQLRATSNFWQTNLEFQDDSGAALTRCKSGGLIHLSAAVELEPGAIEIPEMRWIVMLSGYLCVMMRRDAATGAAAAAAAAG